VLIAIGIVAVVGVLLFTVFRGVLLELVPQVFTRLEVWENPFAYMSPSTGGKGYQPAQSLYAIASGGFWGLGLGQSNQKHGYLPEPYNDYIFAIICEEMGFFGAVLIIGLFAAFAWRGFYIATHSQDKFSSLLVMGIIAHVIIQVILNICVVTNTIPSTGISLPFFSYGGTSLIILLCEMGLVLAVSRYSYTEKA
jgi:cell division protein FtsW